MSMQVGHSTRIEYLDALRAFALLLGIIFHASLSFMPIFIGWAVMDIHTHQAVGIFVLVSHAFRMALFFLIAGFFCRLSLLRSGTKAFLKARTVRLGVPFVVGWFVLSPLIVSGWMMGSQSLQGEVDIVAALSIGFTTLKSLPSGAFIQTHLWFLYYLMMFTLVTVSFKWLLGGVLTRLGIKPNSAMGKITGQVDVALSRLFESRFTIILLAIPSGLCLWFMTHWGLDTPDKSLIPHIPVTLIYGGAFLLGWLFHRQKPLLTHFSKFSWVTVLLCLASILAAVILSDLSTQSSHPNYLVYRAIFCLCYSIMMWSLIMLSFGVFRRYFSLRNGFIRYLSDASYWLYLIHLPIVVWLQVAFAEVDLHWLVKLSCICMITLAVSLLSYDLLVRQSIIGRVLNGKRKPAWLTHYLTRNTSEIT